MWKISIRASQSWSWHIQFTHFVRPTVTNLKIFHLHFPNIHKTGNFHVRLGFGISQISTFEKLEPVNFCHFWFHKVTETVSRIVAGESSMHILTELVTSKTAAQGWIDTKLKTCTFCYMFALLLILLVSRLNLASACSAANVASSMYCTPTSWSNVAVLYINWQRRETVWTLSLI